MTTAEVALQRRDAGEVAGQIAGEIMGQIARQVPGHLTGLLELVERRVDDVTVYRPGERIAIHVTLPPEPPPSSVCEAMFR